MFSVCLVGAVGCIAQTPVPVTFQPAWDEAAALLRTECTRAKVVGAALAFVHGDRVLAHEVCGHADLEPVCPVDRNTNFHWASCTKTFTGIAVMQLRDRGKLQLDEPIADALPELRAVHNPFGPMRAITVTHLLSHAAGFRAPTWPWDDRDPKPWHPHEPTQWSQLVAMMPYTEVEFAPGSRFSYSNPGIVFLGQLIAQRSGEDYEVYMEKNVLRPLGMTQSYFDHAPYHLRKHRSNNFALRGGKAQAGGLDFDTGITVSNGGLNAPLTDMARYLTFLLGAHPEGSDAALVLAHESLHEMWQVRQPISGGEGNGAGGEHQGMGLTFFVIENAAGRFIGHTGGQKSFVTFFYVHPATKTGALGAFNTDSAGPVMAKLRAHLMAKVTPLFSD
jgi:CubicO group peptidase (beta-lactamase class C family)